MAWRAPTVDDLRVKLSTAEIDAYTRDVTDDGTPADSIVLQTADMVRGYIAANRAAVLSPTPHALPDMLISPAMDYAAYDVLKRLDIPVGEAREKARESAEQLFAKIAENKITPEAGAAVSSDAPGVAAPSISVRPAIL